MIDLHAHILPGIDDGPETLAESIEIARAAAADGVRILAATPHVRDDYPTSAGEMRERLAELRDALERARVPLELRSGGELAIDRLTRLPPEELAAFGLGGNPRYLLVEFPYHGWPLELETRILELRARGITPVLAHPERSAEVQADAERLRPLVERGALVQVTAASLDGRLGRRAQATAKALVERQLAHLVGSDAHAPSVRGAGMASAAEAIGDPALARWLCEEVPAAILGGRPVPRRPAPGVTHQQPTRAAALAGLATTAAVAGAVFWLAYDGGTYSLVSRNTLSIAVWWAIGVGVAAGALPRARVPASAWLVAGLLAAFAAWTGASISWAPSAERALNELNRVTLYLGVFLLVALVATRETARSWANGLAAGISVVGLVALGGRLFPDHLPRGTVGEYLGDQLNWPLNYANGLGIFIALAVPVLLRAATAETSPLVRALAIAPLPALAGAVYLTGSRGAFLAAAVGALAYLALEERRWYAATAIATGGAGAAVAIAVLEARPELANTPDDPTAADQAAGAAVLIAAACIGSALAYAVGARLLGRTAPPRTLAWALVAVTAVAAAVAVASADPVERIEAFREPPGTATTQPGLREELLSAAGTGRWQFWSAAADQWREHPIRGQGAGTYESWWAQNGSFAMFIRDAHSLYVETLGELGVVGFGLLAGAFLAGALAGLRRRGDVAAAALVGAFLAFAVGAGVDWMWELTAVTAVGVAALALALAGSGAPSRRLRPLGRAAVVFLALAAVTAAALPALAAVRLADSERAAARGNTRAAVSAALDARDVAPWAASPHVQLALLSEQTGDLRAARGWIAEAIERDPRDWRLWLVRARLETRAGALQAARRSVRQAAALNPRYGLFANLAAR